MCFSAYPCFVCREGSGYAANIPGNRGEAFFTYKLVPHPPILAACPVDAIYPYDQYVPLKVSPAFALPGVFFIFTFPSIPTLLDRHCPCRGLPELVAGYLQKRAAPCEMCVLTRGIIPNLFASRRADFAGFAPSRQAARRPVRVFVV